MHKETLPFPRCCRKNRNKIKAQEGSRSAGSRPHITKPPPCQGQRRQTSPAPCTHGARTAPADGLAVMDAGGSGRGHRSDNTRARVLLPNPPLCRTTICLEKKLKETKLSCSGQMLQDPGSDSARAFHVGSQQPANLQELHFPAEFPPCWSPSSNGVLSSHTALTRRIQKQIMVNSFTASLLPPAAPKCISSMPMP